MMKNLRNTYFAIYLALTLILLYSCDSGVVDNPPPFLEIIDGPTENSTLIVNYVSFAWIGSDNGFEFKYRLLALDEDNFPTSYLDWSDYSKKTEVTFENLDESRYRFEVMAKSQGFEEGPKNRIFEIDAFRGPSLSFFKSETEIPLGATDSISIWLEDVQDLIAMHSVLSFDESKIRLVGFSTGDFVSREGFRLMTVPFLLNSTTLLEINSTGKIEFESVLLPEFSYPEMSISGSGAFISLEFEAIAIGTSKIQYTLIEFYKKDGSVENSNTPREGKITVVAK